MEIRAWQYHIFFCSTQIGSFSISLCPVFCSFVLFFTVAVVLQNKLYYSVLSPTCSWLHGLLFFVQCHPGWDEDFATVEWGKGRMVATFCIRNCALNLVHFALCREIPRRTNFMNRLMRCCVQCRRGGAFVLEHCSLLQLVVLCKSPIFHVCWHVFQSREGRDEIEKIEIWSARSPSFRRIRGSANQTYPFDSAMQRLSCCYKSKALEWLWPAPCEAEMLINLGVLKDIERLLVLEQKLSILQEIGNKALVWTILSAGFWCRPFFLGTLVKESKRGHSGNILTWARVTRRQRAFLSPGSIKDA